MTKRRTLFLLDCLLLGLFTPLLSWRLTGLAWHEALGVTLTLLILTHVAMHWAWMEGRAVAAVRLTRRSVGGFLLNGALFAAMGATIISGFVISKIVLPNRLTPSSYLAWHGIHESATTITLFLVGLHLALNWDRIMASIKARAPGRWNRVPARVALRYAVSIALAAGLVGAGLWGFTRVSPGPREITVVFPDGHEERQAPPAEITRIGPGESGPPPGRAWAKVLMSLAVLAATATVGRRVITARRRRRNPAGQRVERAPQALIG